MGLYKETNAFTREDKRVCLIPCIWLVLYVIRATHVQDCQQTSKGILGFPFSTVPTERWDCMGHLRISHPVPYLYHNPYPAVLDGTAWDVPGHPIPLYQQTDGIAWDVPGHPTLSHYLPINPYLSIHPIPLYQQTDGITWDVPGHPTLSHNTYLSIPTVHPTPLHQHTYGIAWDIPLCPIFTSQSLLSIPSHCTNIQMGLHGTSQDIPLCPISTYSIPARGKHYIYLHTYKLGHWQ